MLTHAQINAENQSPALTEEQELALTMLVRQYHGYAAFTANWPNFTTKLADEQATPTVKTKALKAVLTALGRLPSIDVESQGTADSESFFATKRNWDRLAQDVLNVLFDTNVYYTTALSGTHQMFATVPKKKVKDLTLNDSTLRNDKARESGRYEW